MATRDGASELGIEAAVSLLRATLESTADGILVVDGHGRIASFNHRFATMWHIPYTILASGDDDRALAYVTDQLVDPGRFLEKVRELYERPDADSFDVLHFKDGRVFERYSHPQRLDGQVVGRVWSFRDVSEKTRVLEALRLAEERYRGIVEQSVDGIFLFDADSKRVLDANAALLRMLGYSADELTRLTIFDFVAHPRDEVARNVERVLAERQLPIGLRRYRCKDGSHLDVEVYAGAVPYGGRTAISVVAHDVTQRRRDDEHLRLLAQAVESSSDMISVTDLEDRFTFVNQAFLEQYGFTEAEIVGRHVTTVDSPGNSKALRARIFEDSRGRGFRGELLNRRKDGSEFPISLSTAPVRDRSGHVLGLVGVARDITDRRKAEALERALYRIAERASVETDLPRFYAFLHAVLGELMDARNFYVAVLEPHTGLLTFPYFADVAEPAPEPRRPSGGLTEWVLSHGETLLYTIEEGERLKRVHGFAPLGAPSVDWLGVPLKSGDATFGVLAVQSYEESVRFGDREREILTFVARQVQGALERNRAEDALRESEERFRTLSNATFEGIVLHEGGRILEANRAFTEMAGSGEASLVGSHLLDLIALESVDRFAENLANPTDEPFEVELKRGDASRLPVEVQSKTIRYRDGTARVTAVRDVSERNRLEEQLRQAQKMEAVGRLAGGIAHDFNNLLTTILGYSDLVLAQLPEVDVTRADIQEIKKAGERAAALTKQLLAFSRKQILAPQLLDLNAAVRNMEKMLRRLIGEVVDLVAVLDDDIGSVKADPSQIEQLVVNLAVNARDAMPDGGTLRIETERVDGAEAGLAPGWWVQLVIADSGVGMDADTRAHLFEPFFTTKEKGRGTGLGLATVYGAVTQAGGTVRVDSEPGNGTAFRIFFPEVSESERRPSGENARPGSTDEIPVLGRHRSRGGETVLVAEDEETVRGLARRVLEAAGYTVLEARDGAEGLREARRHSGPIDLLLSDLVMPVMSGEKLAEQLALERPDLRVLFMSGYTEDVAVRKAIADSGVAFLQKPFAAEQLAEKVRETLDSRRHRRR